VSDCVLIRAVYLLYICISHVAESRSNPDEVRLRRCLFDRAKNQSHDLMATPIASANEVLLVKFSINILKLIALVKTVVLILFGYVHIFT